jgi:hypothetical protein
MGTTVEME